MRRALGLVVLISWLAACTVTPPRGPTGVAEQLWRSRQVALAALTAWSFDGRIGVVSGEQGWHAALNWRQRADGYDIRITGPLGQGVGWLRGGQDGVVLHTPDNKEFRAADAETLLATQFGWWVPVGGLHYWLRGLPDPRQPTETTLDHYGRLVHLVQAGWDITFTRYATVAALELPDRLTLDNQKIKVRLVIDHWQR